MHCQRYLTEVEGCESLQTKDLGRPPCSVSILRSQDLNKSRSITIQKQLPGQSRVSMQKTSINLFLLLILAPPLYCDYFNPFLFGINGKLLLTHDQWRHVYWKYKTKMDLLKIELVVKKKNTKINVIGMRFRFIISSPLSKNVFC